MENKKIEIWPQLMPLIVGKHVVPIIGREVLTVTYEGRETLLYPLIAEKLAEKLNLFVEDIFSEEEIKADKRLDNPKITVDILPKGEEINTVVCSFIKKGNDIEDIYPILFDVIPNDDKVSIPEPLLKLAGIQEFKLFVSTTFDNLMERALNEVRFEGQTKTRVLSFAPNDVQDLPGSIKDLDRPIVFHLLGKKSLIPEYAVTQEDTLEFLFSLQSDSLQPKVLFDELSRTNLLLLGCSFGNWLARFFLRTAKRKRLRDSRGYKEYVADDTISSDTRLVVFLERFSPYTKILKGVSAKEFINNLHRDWTEYSDQRAKDPVKLPATIPVAGTEPGAVFLSYAHEDKNAADKIRRSLEAEGVDVFFDKTDLRGGDDFKAKIEREISRCSLFIPVLSGSTLTQERRFFRGEWNTAVEEAKKTPPSRPFIYPVVIDNTSEKVPDLPEKFYNVHWEAVPSGDVTPKFITEVKQLFREYQKAASEAT